MRNLISPIFFLTICSCTSDTTQKLGHPKKGINPCETARDTIINIKTVFTKDSSSFPTQKLYSIISFIKSKGLFKPNADKTHKIKIKRENSKTYSVAYDSCNHSKWIEKNFILTNINVTTVDFKATRPDSYSGLIPGLHLEEWKFANNADRDSAMKLVNMAYQHPDNIIMYEKRYSQFILDDKRIFLLEARAKFSEQYAIVYKKFIEEFLNKGTNSGR